MRKLIVAAALAALVCASVAVAGGGLPTAGEYGGKAMGDPNDYVGFDVDTVNGHKVVRHVRVLNLPYACNDGSLYRLTSYPRYTGTFRVHHSHGKRRFGGAATTSFQEQGSIRMRIRGRLRKGRRATGTIALRYKGESFNCYTGTLNWTAKKPSPALPPDIST